MSEIKSILSAQTSLKEKTSGSISSAEPVAYISTELKEKYYVIDTNIIIDNPDIIPTKNGFKKLAIKNIDLKNSCIVVPDTVLHELKSFRNEATERGFIAGKVIHRIDELQQSVLDNQDKLGYDVRINIGNQIAFKNCSRAFMVIKSTESATVTWDFEPVNMDEQIFLQTLSLASCLTNTRRGREQVDALNRLVRLVTNDKEMRVCALAHNIKSLPLITDPKFKFTGRRKCVIPPDLYNTFMQKGGFITLEEWEERMPNEPTLVPNEFIEFSCEADSDYDEIGNSRGKFWNIGRLDVTGDEDKIVHLNNLLNGKFKPFLEAMTPGQAMYLDSIYNKDIRLILASGVPGSGKTFIPVVEGMYQVQTGRYDSIPVIASMSNIADDGVGTLPGGLEDKMSIKSGNIISALISYHKTFPDDPCNPTTLVEDTEQSLMHQAYIHKKNWILEDDEEYTSYNEEKTYTYSSGKKHKQQSKRFSKDKYTEKTTADSQRTKQQIIENKAILSFQKSFRSEPLFYIRGKNYRNEFVIVDEAQSMNNKEIKTIVTRIAEGSKIIFTGDESQSHPSAKHVNQYSNGILFTRRALKGISGAAQIPMDKRDIVRDKLICQILENIEAKDSDEFDDDDNNYVTD